VLLPLSIPAGVALAELGRMAYAGRRQVAAGAIIGCVVLTGVTGVGLMMQHNSASVAGAPVVQWAQPGEELRDALAAIEVATRGHDGVDLLYVGGEDGAYHVADQSTVGTPPPGGRAGTSGCPCRGTPSGWTSTSRASPPTVTSHRSCRTPHRW
jgi:hypothetical protein